MKETKNDVHDDDDGGGDNDDDDVDDDDDTLEQPTKTWCYLKMCKNMKIDKNVTDSNDV